MLWKLFVPLCLLGRSIEGAVVTGTEVIDYEIDPPVCNNENEIYTECGSACPTTCADLLNPEPKACILLCVPGCFCKENYVRDDSGKCIPRENCPTAPPTTTTIPACGPKEEYLACGTACPPTCKDPKPAICTKQCVQGCFCKPGFVRNKYGKCILPSKCPERKKHHKKSSSEESCDSD